MKYLNLIFAVIILTIWGCEGQSHENGDSDAPPPRDGVFIHISSDDPHRVLMALSLADKMAEDKDVMVFFDIEGVEVVMKDSDDITFEAFESSKTLLGKLLANNVLIEVCPMCLKAKGYTMEEVMSGINLAEKDDFFNFTNGRILTLDY